MGSFHNLLYKLSKVKLVLLYFGPEPMFITSVTVDLIDAAL